MRRFRYAALLLLLLVPGALSAQRDSARNDFLNAESWFLLEEYNEAEFIYQKLLRYDPANDNLKYRIGICLLNDPYRKEQSIRYLQEASQNINPQYKESSFQERTAPPDVLYYLANAYLANEMPDQAIQTYRRFLENLDPEVYDDELVRAQIKACENAKRLMKQPVDIDLHPLETNVNTRYPEINPVISGDGNRMAFVTRQPFFDEALFIQKTDSGWTLPMSLTSMLGFDRDIYPVALSYDGTEMLLYYDDEYIGNLYYSRLEDGFWLPARKMEENITTKYWESHACFARDGKSIYFTSNRKGGYGGLDIYRAERLADGSFGEPVNLGSTVNTRYNEETPFITEDGNTLYFSSYGHFNIGGYDIFYSTKDAGGRWSEPVNLGYPINTTGDDIFFHPVNNGLGGYQSRYAPGGQGRHDIYYMDIYSVNNPRMYVVTGFVRTEDGGTNLTLLEMLVIDPSTGDTVRYSIPIDEKGAFRLELPQGEYALHFSGEGYQELIRPLSITPASNKKGITLAEPIELALIEVVPLIFEGEESMIHLRDTLYEGVAGKPLSIPVRLDEEGLLLVKVFQDSVLVSVDTIQADRRRTEIEIVPLPGTSRVELKMTDSQGNIHRNSVTVIGTVPPPPPRKRKEEAAETTGAEQQAAGQDTGEAGGPGGGPGAAGLESFVGAAGAAMVLQLAGDDERLLQQHLLENSSGPLNAYLAGLDLEKEGITTTEELLRHLERVAQEQGFTMEDVRAALSAAMGHPLEVERLHAELLAQSEGEMLEILQGIDPKRDGIYTVEELISAIRQALMERGYSDREIRKILREMFPDHSAYIRSLTGKGGRAGGSAGIPVAVTAGIILAGGLLLWLILFWLRRRKKEE